MSDHRFMARPLRIECHAYCLMDNHYHLLIHTPIGQLGRAMRHLNWPGPNGRRPPIGPLWKRGLMMNSIDFTTRPIMPLFWAIR